MKRHPPDVESPRRWRDRPSGGNSDEDRAAMLVRDALAWSGFATELDERRTASVEERLHPKVRVRPPRWLRPALVVALLTVCVASVMGYERGWFEPLRERLRFRSIPSSVPAATARRSKAPPRAASDRARGEPASEPEARSDAREPEIEAPPRAPVPVLEPLALREPPPKTAGAAPRARLALADRPPTPAARLEPRPDSLEIKTLQEAVGLLRGKHDASAALAALDGYLERFPTGLLSHEARVARIDALLMLDRTEEALRALEVLPLDTHRRSTELQVMRGELRARTDCQRAEADFTAVLGRVQTPALEERALYDRAACHNALGETGAAAQDLRRYLDRFPNGTHAGWARRWLDNNQ